MTIRVGIVGTGGISRAHQRSYTAIGGFEIVAVCDIIKSKANEPPISGVSRENTSSQATTRCLKWTKLIRSVFALTTKATDDPPSQR